MMTLIMLGVAVHLYAVSILTAFVVEGDLSNYFWKRRMSRKIESLKDHYVVCGAGETGMRIIDELIKTKRSFVVVDSDEKAVAGIRAMKEVCVIQGDAYDEQILANAGIERAAAAAVVLPTDRDNLVTTLSIRTMNPKIRIVVKEIEPGMASRFRRAGADTIVNPTTIGGLRLVSEMVSPVCGVVPRSDAARSSSCLPRGRTLHPCEIAVGQSSPEGPPSSLGLQTPRSSGTQTGFDGLHLQPRRLVDSRTRTNVDRSRKSGRRQPGQGSRSSQLRRRLATKRHKKHKRVKIDWIPFVLFVPFCG